MVCKLRSAYWLKRISHLPKLERLSLLLSLLYRVLETLKPLPVHKMADGNNQTVTNVTSGTRLTTRHLNVDTSHKFIAPKCWHKDTVRNKCNKPGHLAKVCQSKKDTPLSSISKKQFSTHVVTE